MEIKALSRVSSLILISFVVFSSNVGAAAVTVSFNGSVSQINGTVLDSFFSTGQILSGDYSFDPGAVDLLPASLVGMYAINALDGEVNGYMFSGTASEPGVIIIDPSSFDSYTLDSNPFSAGNQLVAAPLGGLTPDWFSFAIVYPGDEFSDDALPGGAPSLGGGSVASWAIGFVNPTNPSEIHQISGTLTSVSVQSVPLPGAFWLFLSGLAGITHFRQKATKYRSKI